jgi:hypothetical protein
LGHNSSGIGPVAQEIQQITWHPHPNDFNGFMISALFSALPLLEESVGFFGQNHMFFLKWGYPE